MNQRLKKMLIFSASALMFLSVGTGLANISSNVHADSGVQEELANLKAGDKAMEEQGHRDETHAEIMGDRKDPDALAEDVDYNYSFVKHHKSQLFRGLPKSVIKFAKLNRESMLKKGMSTTYTYDDYIKMLKSHKNKRSHKSRKHLTYKHKATQRTNSHKRRITKHYKLHKRINRKRSRKNRRNTKRVKRVTHRHYHHRK